MKTLTYADHAREGERNYMSREWDTQPCTHCPDSWLPTRLTRDRGWICKVCDGVLDRHNGEQRRKGDWR